jgi:hypothetical protein
MGVIKLQPYQWIQEVMGGALVAMQLTYVSVCVKHPESLPMLALTSSTSGGRSVGIVRLWTKATEFFYIQ